MATDISGLPEHFQHYINLVKEDDVVSVIEKNSREDFRFFDNITEKQSEIRYAEGKWSIREVLQHIIDCERVFSYRILALARGETQTLQGFDENLYAQNAHVEDRTWESLKQEYRAVRNSSEALIRSLNEEDLKRIGKAGNYSISAESMILVMTGHVKHHIQITEERYLK